MEAILFDCRDKGLGSTLRIVDDEGRLLLQGSVYGDSPAEVCTQIAAGLGLTLDYRKPAAVRAGKPAVAVPAAVQAGEPAVAVPCTVQSGSKQPHFKKERMLF